VNFSQVPLVIGHTINPSLWGSISAPRVVSSANSEALTCSRLISGTASLSRSDHNQHSEEVRELALGFFLPPLVTTRREVQTKFQRLLPSAPRFYLGLIVLPHFLASFYSNDHCRGETLIFFLVKPFNTACAGFGSRSTRR
jgi:hypothetical protein